MSYKKNRRFDTEQITTDFPNSVLTCHVILPHAQRIWKTHEHTLNTVPEVASDGQYDTDAVLLTKGMVWIHRTFRIYQWRLEPLGLSVQPWCVATIHFHQATWEIAHGLCHTLIQELNLGPLSLTSQKLLSYASQAQSNCPVAE